jgi:nucleoside-triphosphatase THEP1
VDIEALERVGVAALREAITQGRVVIVDEIGKMELFSEAFQEAVLSAVEGSQPVIATVMSGSNPWVDALKARSNVSVWSVTRENRDDIPERVLEWLGSIG